MFPKAPVQLVELQFAKYLLPLEAGEGVRDLPKGKSDLPRVLRQVGNLIRTMPGVLGA
jgi:hypothetical protein